MPASVQPTLSICMIVKNEEADLTRCLASVHGLADEILVVDTGSSDGTAGVARSFGARVVDFVWQDDFSLARNFSIEQATGTWILILDADESIAARDHASIRGVLPRADVDVVKVRQRNYVPDTPVGWQAAPGGYDEGAPYRGFVDVEQRRLFRKGRLLYRNRVHEHLYPVDTSQPLREARGDWVVHHYGKVGQAERLRAKAEHYLRIGKRKVEEHPTDAAAHYELGIQYLELQQPDAALASFERAAELSPGLTDTPLRIAMCHVMRKDYQHALAALHTAARALPNRAAEIAFETGNVHRALGDDAAAEHELRRALRINPAFAAASVNLALALERQGHRPAALASLDDAIARTPANEHLRFLRARLRRQAGDEGGALSDLEALGANVEALRQRARMLARQRRFAEARECLASAGDATDADLLSLRGTVALALGQLDEAITDLQRSIEIQPTEEATRNLAMAMKARDARRP
jgi:tetratricopeptide (TPR) repeat protein